MAGGGVFEWAEPYCKAWVILPNYFDALSRDCRYQLTSIGVPQPHFYISREVNGFQIGGGRPNARASWQVTGVRQDPRANVHRIPVEEDKPVEKRGSYLYPELYDTTAEKY